MCIIIDANYASDVFRDIANENYAPIINWLFVKDGILVYGGKLAIELLKIGVAQRTIKVLGQAGRAVHIPDSDVDKEEQNVVRLGICHSDDPHVIALARLSGARTLCSHDHALHEDFKNKMLINKPKGSIYQEKSHLDLLKHTSGCRKPK